MYLYVGFFKKASRRHIVTILAFLYTRVNRRAVASAYQPITGYSSTTAVAPHTPWDEVSEPREQ